MVPEGNPPPDGDLRHLVGAIIVAGGKSKRMGGVDKVFAPIQGMPLIAHTVELFEHSPLIQELVLVLARDKVQKGLALSRERGWKKLVTVCSGGRRRQDSVRCGLERLSPCTWVVVHDGARPCLDSEVLQRGLEAVQETGAAVAGVPATDTIKMVSSKSLVQSTLDRNSLWLVQTPQLFHYQLLLRAHATCHQEVTDDAAMVEAMGHPVKMFMGLPHNLKVTTPQDLALVEAVLRRNIKAESPE